MDTAIQHPAWVEQKLPTFFSTDEVTLGKGRGRSLSPTSRSKRGGQIKCGGGVRSSVLAFQHLLDEGAALSNVLVDNKLLVIGGDEEDHCCSSG